MGLVLGRLRLLRRGWYKMGLGRDEDPTNSSTKAFRGGFARVHAAIEECHGSLAATLSDRSKEPTVPQTPKSWNMDVG